MEPHLVVTSQNLSSKKVCNMSIARKPHNSSHHVHNRSQVLPELSPRACYHVRTTYTLVFPAAGIIRLHLEEVSSTHCDGRLEPQLALKGEHQQRQLGVEFASQEPQRRIEQITVSADSSPGRLVAHLQAV
jgi:hypothetical protein